MSSATDLRSGKLGWIRSFLGRGLGSRGFTLIEIMTVVVIIAIIAGSVVPSVLGMLDLAKEDACEVNIVEVEREYQMHLVMDIVKHTDKLFASYLKRYDEICPDDGEVTYADEKVECSLHPGDMVADGKDGEVPYM